MNMLWALVLILGCLAVFEDLRRSHIPNWINVGALAAALLYQTFSRGWEGLLLTAAGAAIGFAIFLPFFFLGRGGGDIKLMAAFGALLGPSRILVAALLCTLIGGLLAAAMLAWNHHRRTIPYAPAITLGAWLALLSRG